jgi:hypothetical protein
VDRQTIQRHLQRAEIHIFEAKQLVARQREMVAELEKYEHDLEAARNLLVVFEEISAMQVAHRGQLQRELAEALANESTQ